LHDEPEIMALLNAVLDRFDQQSATDRQRPTWIAVEKHLHSLARMDAQADQLWKFVLQLQSLAVLSIKLARKHAYDAEWHQAKLGFNIDSEATLRAWLNRPASPPPMKQWQAAVQQHADLFTNGIAPLLERRIVIAQRSDDEVIRAIATLGNIQSPATLRQLSTHAFWGDSKVLDDREDLITTLFPSLILRDRAIVVAVHLPATIAGVLFIENQDTYTHALDGEYTGTAELALVYLSGFKNTAERIREQAGARLHFSGTLNQAAHFSEWWFGNDSNITQLFFWGDLDFAGMQMLKLLRQRFGNVQAWQPGYASMIDQVVRCGGKQSISESMQTDPQLTGCEYADSVLLPTIREHGFLDQERLEA
jgi:hypothetical protein